MASSLRVNSIIPSSGTNVAIGTAGGTISYNASVSGVSTFSSGITIGTGASISSPETNVLALGTNNTEKVRVGAAGSVGIKTSNPQIDLQISQSGGIQVVNTSEIALRYNVYYDGSVDRYIQSSNKAASLVVNSSGEFLFYNTNTASSSANSTISGWASRVKIDSSGAVSMPYQPAFRAVREGGGNPVITSAQRLPYDSTSANGGFDNTNSYNTSTFIYTAPVAGVYFFQASTYTELNTESMWDIRVNGNIRQRAELRQTAGDDIGDNTIINASCILSLAANDQVDVYWASNSVQLITGSGLISFSGCKIS